MKPWYRVASQRDLLALDNAIQKNVVDPRGLKMVFAIQGGNVSYDPNVLPLIRDVTRSSAWILAAVANALLLHVIISSGPIAGAQIM